MNLMHNAILGIADLLDTSVGTEHAMMIYSALCGIVISFGLIAHCARTAIAACNKLQDP